jgi:hypothetical protein
MCGVQYAECGVRLSSIRIHAVCSSVWQSAQLCLAVQQCAQKCAWQCAAVRRCARQCVTVQRCGSERQSGSEHILE